MTEKIKKEGNYTSYEENEKICLSLKIKSLIESLKQTSLEIKVGNAYEGFFYNYIQLVFKNLIQKSLLRE